MPTATPKHVEASQQDPERIYGFPFAGLEIKFRVEEETLYVCEVNKEERK